MILAHVATKSSNLISLVLLYDAKSLLAVLFSLVIDEREKKTKKHNNNNMDHSQMLQWIFVFQTTFCTICNEFSQIVAQLVQLSFHHLFYLLSQLAERLTQSDYEKSPMFFPFWTWFASFSARFKLKLLLGKSNSLVWKSWTSYFHMYLW